MSLRRVAALALPLAAVLACSSPPPEWHEADDHRWRELRVSGDDEGGFTPLSPSRTGVEFSNRVDTEAALENEHLLIGSGVALGDFDGDGRADIYLTRLQGPNALYRNLGGWEFEEITDSAGVAAADRPSTGAAAADVDGDGDLDLVVTSLGGPDVVYRNDGAGRFTEVDAGLAGGSGSTTATLADVDGDGDLDLYRTTYKAESASDVLRTFERPMSELEGEIVVEEDDSMVVAPRYREHYRIDERQGRRVVVEQAEPDRLYLNDGTGRFEPVPWTDGAFRDEAGRPLEEDVADFGLAARFHDVNDDGRPDLYVCNDFHDPDRLWINQGEGRFRAAPRHALRKMPHASMSVDFADVDRDGDVDVFAAEMQSRELRRRLLEIPLRGPYRSSPGLTDDRPQVQRNTLFLNRGDGSFAEVAQLAGVDASDWTWASAFLDVDLDGYEDLLVANGYSRDILHGDVAARITELQGRASTREMKRLYPEFPNRNAAFRNQGDLTFRDTGEGWGIGTESDVSHGMATADLDGDGDLDVVINRLGEPARVLRNDAGARRVAVRLRGVPPNTRGVGAKVRLEGGPVPVQEKEVTAGGLYLSGAAPQVTFAGGEAGSLSLEVAWPGGGETVIHDVRPNRLYEVRETAGDAADGARPDGSGAAGADDGRSTRLDGGSTEPEPGSNADGEAAGERSGPLFSDRTDALDHRHPEDEFGDFERQPLLPFRPGRLGPGVSWVDVEGDGDPDLVVPPGAGGRASYLRNEDGAFTPVPLETEPGRLDRTSVAALPGEGGGSRLLMGQSNWEAGDREAARDAPAVLSAAPGGGPARRDLGPAVEGAPSGVGPLATADVDGDGDLDLFVGGRIVHWAYPVTASSRLLRNEDGSWRRDPADEELLEGIGMVSGAVFTDVDADGDPDLVLAHEWGPVRLLLNEDGAFRDATAEWGLDGLSGRWNGIAAGDFDEDGRMDLVVTGWGRNVRPRPSPDRPLVLFSGDFDRNGSWDFLPAQEAPEGGGFVPLEPYERFRRAVPSIRSRLSGHEAYSEAGLEEILGVAPESAYRMVARRYAHLLLINRGDRFEASPLPLEAQMAPSTGVAVGDLDGDGHEDLFLSQNFYPTAYDVARHDAGLGLVLLGDGDGGLEPLSASRSGIRIHGDQRGAALSDYDGDGRVDLAVAQNGGPTRLFRNEAARPGLRVRLEGPDGNPDAVGAVLRVVYGDGTGPAREIHGGSGYWSWDHVEPVLGLRAEPEALWVRWPGGGESRVAVPAGARELTVTAEE